MGKALEAAEKMDISTWELHALARRERRLLAAATSSSSWAAFSPFSSTWVLPLLACVVCWGLLVPDKECRLQHKRLAPRDEASPLSHAEVLDHQHLDQLHCSGSSETCRRQIPTLPRMLTAPWESSQAVALHPLQGQPADQTTSCFP